MRSLPLIVSIKPVRSVITGSARVPFGNTNIGKTLVAFIPVAELELEVEAEVELIFMFKGFGPPEKQVIRLWIFINCYNCLELIPSPANARAPKPRRKGRIIAKG